MDIEISLTSNQVKALRICLGAEIKNYVDRVGHAKSHGDTYTDHYGEQLLEVFDKINEVPFVG